MDYEQQWLQRIRCEYIEMPGLGLTLSQAQRLWSLDVVACARLLDTLVTVDFLVMRPDGRYVRASEDPQVRSRLDMANAPLPHKNRSTSVA